ncbi:microbial collagenase [Burkholderia ambifaria MEX-5]|uniref:Microbial collagenase n=2 Tax=Burkholderia ambifaria TaxID=152480 RepID=B1TFN1_9BURK|nr:microbial collagenase [Burkholderia ambifaria MEX-5]
MVWWIEGLGEYLSKGNDNPESIEAVRFMFGRHRDDVSTIVSRFRIGDYDGYANYLAHIDHRYDQEFADWARYATTAGELPFPQPAH